MDFKKYPGTNVSLALQQAEEKIQKGETRNVQPEEGADSEMTQSSTTEEESLIPGLFADSEFRYQQIVEMSHDGILLLNAKKQIIFANEKLCEILEVRPSEVKQYTLFDFIDDAARLELERILINATSKVEKLTLRLLTKNKKIISAAITLRVLSDKENKCKGLLAMVSDITEKVALEKLLDNATNMARIGGFDVDLLKGTTYWSPMTREIHEVDPEFEPHHMNDVAFYKHQADRDALTAALNDALNNGKSWDLELLLKTAKGNECWVRTIGEPEFVAGTCVRITGSFQDINSTKKAQLEVLQIANEKNTILESIGDSFFAVDKNWMITYCNKEAERFFGMNRQDIVGRSLWEAYPETVDTVFHNYYQKAIAENTAQHFEACYEKLNVWIEVSAYPLPEGLTVYLKDISQRKRAEEERAELMSQIIRRNKDLEQFSYMVSHNLRAPVANIIGLAEELNYEGHSIDVKKMLTSDMLVSVNRLDEVIYDLNTILQLKKDQPDLREKVNFDALTHGISNEISTMLQQQKVQIITDFKVASIISIKSYLHSIFYNLIVNSIKYRRDAVDPIITISSVENQDGLLLTFIDNGIGMDLESKADQVFGLYKRFHHHVDGKGLGLFMVKTQVEILGGSISLNSEVDKGTAFRIQFSNQ